MQGSSARVAQPVGFRVFVWGCQPWGKQVGFSWFATNYFLEVPAWTLQGEPRNVRLFSSRVLIIPRSLSRGTPLWAGWREWDDYWNLFFSETQISAKICDRGVLHDTPFHLLSFAALTFPGYLHPCFHFSNVTAQYLPPLPRPSLCPLSSTVAP